MTSLIQRSLAGGELAPALRARADQVKYATGLRTCRNFRVMKHGGVSNRAGFQYLATGKTVGKRVRLFRFKFSNSQTYALELGDRYMRVYRLGAAVLATATLGAWSNLTTYQVGDVVTRSGNTYAANDINVNKDPIGGFGPIYWQLLTNGIYERSMPFLDTELADIKYTQSGDIVTMTHQTYGVVDVQRTDHARWSLNNIFTAVIANIGTPTTAFASGGAGGNEYHYKVTAIKEETYEESLPEGASQGGAALAAPTEAAPHSLTWLAVTGAAAYNVYKGTTDGAFGFIAQVIGLGYKDRGLVVPDYSIAPPQSRPASSAFANPGNFPGAVSYFQQRLCLARTINNPRTVWASRSGTRNNLLISYPQQENDSIMFTLVGTSEVLHLMDIDTRFIVFTVDGEYVIEGDSEGILTPAQPNPRQFGYNGSSAVQPIVVDKTALYVQARGNIVRDLRHEVSSTDGRTTYRGRDLCIFSEHLFSRYTILDMDYQQVPDSIVWIVRSDGVLLGLTYLPDQEIWGWHHHDTDGFVESVCVVPEGNEDILYLVVRRTIGGVDYRYIERMHTRVVTNVKTDAFFVDAGLTYDGRNTTATTMTLSGGGAWTVVETLTLTASAGFFVAGDVGNEIAMRAGTDEIRVRITAYTSATVVSGMPSKTVPTSLRGVAITNWGKAVETFAGLSHLEGKSVIALGDGTVEAPQTVVGGTVTYSHRYEVAHIGLSYVADIETLDLEIVNGQTLSDKKKRVTSLTMFLQDTQHIKAGPDADHLREIPVQVANYADASKSDPDKVELTMNSTWNDNGRVFIRQDKPLPAAVLAVVPSGFIGG